MEPSFPTFDLYSIPLLLLLAQGFIFVVLISLRYLKLRYSSDLFLGSFLLLFCYERIHYTIGFMAWYDSFPNTKVNYFLFPMALIFGPLLYFYVKSVTSASFKFLRQHTLHFIPFLIYFLYRIFLYSYDSFQNGFEETQNGELMRSIELGIVNPLMILFSSFHLLLYLAFTIQLFWYYRLKIIEFYSDTYRFELNWIRNFLLIFGLLFLYDVFQNVIDSFIVDLHWIQKWWYHALSSAVIIYFGIKGYFTKTLKLQDVNFTFMPHDSSQDVKLEKENPFSSEVVRIEKYMNQEKPYLDPSLNLSQLSKSLNYPSAQLSEIINIGFSMNFNDFVNAYRVDAVKEALDQKKYESHSLVGIAYDSGFNSKATFNRVFKKLTGISPSQYIANQ